MGERWDRFWYAEVAATRLDAFRQALLFSLVLYMLARWMHAEEWLTAQGFHPSPAADLRYASVVPLLPPALLPAFGALLFGSMALVIFGWLRRPATWLTLALVTYVSLADPVSAFTLNRLYVLTLLVLALAPETCPSGQGPVMPAWPLRVLQLGLLVHYLAAGLCKALQGDWLRGHDVLWMQIQGLYMTDAAAWLVRTLPPWAFAVQQHAALGFELLAPLLLGVKRLRPAGLVIGVVMHVIIAVTMKDLIYFTLQMLCFYLLFIDAATIDRWRRRLTGDAQPATP